MDNPIYQSIEKAARTTGLAVSYLRAGVKKNEIPGFYSGKKFLVNVPLLLAVLEEQCKQNGGVGA